MLHRRASRGAGFTMIEVMIVVVILALLAAISIVQLQRARATTYEQLAIGSLRHIAQACQMFYISNQTYPPDLTWLSAPQANPPYLTPDLIGNGATVTKQGFTFTYSSGGGSSFTLLADPATPGVTGSRHFYVDQSMVIHVNGSGPAGVTDPALS